MSEPSNMEVDEPEAKKVKVSPLALISMADQYTRITCGGSPLDPKAPVTGFLFGQEEDDMLLVVTDAEDIPLQASQTQVELHQKVFPTHQVVGWYRVSSMENEPQAMDLAQTQTLQEMYPTLQLFGLLQVNTNDDRKPSANDDNDDDELPFSIFFLKDKVLVHQASWELQTNDAERIGIERVVRERPKDSQQLPLVQKTSTLLESLQGIQDRVQILLTFLEQVQTGSVPFEPSLIRQVQTLLVMMGPIASKNLPSTPSTVSQIAQLGKMVEAIQKYTEKCRIVQEGSKPAARAGMRRF